MTRRLALAALLCGAALAALPLGALPAPTFAADEAAAQSVSFTQSWTRQIAPGRAVSTSSPVLVANGGNPFVAAADNSGALRAYDLDDGAPVPGWGSATVSFGVRAPLSSDGVNTYVPVATDGIARYPRYMKVGPNGAEVWNSNPSTVLPSSPAYGFLLSGMSLANIGGQWRGWAGSSGQWVYGIDAQSGAKAWEFLNADSTMATPAVVDLYGTGTPQVVMSTDASPEWPGDRAGGLLRIFTHDGAQVCTATQFVDGYTFAASGYNNSSPSVATVDGRPLIVFGSTGPVQTGTGGNQVVGYDADCTLRWASPPLAAQALPTPTFADVRGRGAPDVVQLVAIADGANTYPRVYVLDASTGAVVADSGTSLRSYGAALAYPETLQLTTADVNADGAQDLFVPARQGAMVVLNGKNLSVLTTINTNLVIQNTPIVTATANGVRITLAGYNGLGAQVSSYVATGAQLGNLGWRSFGGNPQLTGTQGTISGPHDQLLEGQFLNSGQQLRRNGCRAVMQGDGNFVVYGPDDRPRWSTNTNKAGSAVRFATDGTLEVRGPGSTLEWREPATGSGVERAVLGADCVLRVTSGLWATTRRINTQRVIWAQDTGPTPWDRLRPGGTLPSGQYLVSANGSARLEMQPDGNLVVYWRNQWEWQSGTLDRTGRAYLVLQPDGNLVIYNERGWAIRSWDVGGGGGERLVLGDDGILRLETWNGTIVWASNRRTDAPPPPAAGRRVK